MIDERIMIDTNEHGLPVFSRSENVKVEVVVRENPVTMVKEIEIVGDEASLRRLAEVLIGVSKVKGYHVHLESSRDASVLDLRPNDVRLTLSNSELQVPSSSPQSAPPDWAKG